MSLHMRPVECPDDGCGHYAPPVRGQGRITKRRLWLCESCRRRLPVKTPPSRKRRRQMEDDYR